MRKIKVRVPELIEKVRANREKHISEFKEACSDYKQDALAAIDKAIGSLRDRVAALKDGELLALVAVQFQLPYPQSHEKDYDQVITMLEMSVETEIEIESEEFSCYVMDCWDWKQQFDVTRNSYSNKMAVRR